MPLKVFRIVNNAVFHASRQGRCAEVTAWSNAVAALALGAGAFYLAGSWFAAAGAALLSFALLRAALISRRTLWIAAAFGTVTVAAVAGGLGWLFAHLIESAPSAPVVGAVVMALLGATGPAWAYSRLARQREDARDSILDPISVPSSR
jgi:hypothetical protein